MEEEMSSHADTPELVKLAAKAMQNDPEGPAGELVRAWKLTRAETQRLREAGERVDRAFETVGFSVDDEEPETLLALRNLREALAGDAE
jgi:hypothetical protein